MNTQFISIQKLEIDTLPCEISKTTLYRWQREGRYPKLYKKVGGKVYIDFNALLTLLEQGE